MARATLCQKVSVYGWTLNDPVSMWRMMSLGVAGIIIDEAALARPVLEKLADLSPVERLLVRAVLLFDQPIPTRVYRVASP